MCSVLPTTASYPKPGSRFAHYTPSKGPGISGKLEIVYRNDDGTESRPADVYPLTEDTTAPLPVRRFWVGRYLVTCCPGQGRRLGYLCNCKSRGGCKHGDSVLNLLVKGELDRVVADEYPQYAAWTDDELELMQSAAMSDLGA